MMKPSDQRLLRGLSLVGFVAVSGIAVASVLAYQAWTAFLLFARPEILGPVLRGVAIVVVLLGCQFLTPGGVFRTARGEICVGVFISTMGMLAGVLLVSTSIPSVTEEWVTGMATVAFAVPLMLLGHRFSRKLTAVARIVIGTGLISIGLIVPARILERFLIDLL